MSDPITLDPSDYWRLMAFQARAQSAKVEADLAQARGLLKAQASGVQAGAVYDELAAKYGLDSKTRYQADDGACTMTPQQESDGKA